jgi:hypothetical protein
VLGSSAANVPVFRSPGRPAGVDTGRRQLVDAILRDLAIELQVPLTAITHYDAATWSYCISKLTSPVISRLMARLAHTLPHPTAGSPANVSDRDRGYAAGFVDGEGCICIFKPKVRKNRTRQDLRPVLQVGQSNHRVLKRLQATLGAWSYVHPGKQNIQQNRQTYGYMVASAPHIIHALCAIFDLLEVKRNQAEALVRFFIEGRQWRFGPGTPAKVRARREYWYKRLRRMK